MWEDPIAAEVHQIREKLAAEYNYDVGAFFADLRKRQASLGCRLVPQKTRPEPTAEVDRRGELGSADSTATKAAPAT